MWSLKPFGACVRVCVCFIGSDVCGELKHKHQVNLCLPSFWDRIIDSPLELTLLINPARHQEEWWVKKAASECCLTLSWVFFLLSAIHICSFKYIVDRLYLYAAFPLAGSLYSHTVVKN